MEVKSNLLAKLICLLLAVFANITYGQGPSESTVNIDYNNIKMPEAPNSTGFSMYGNTSVNSATGIPNISIPLYTLEIDGVSVPISLNYDASGVKVGKLASAVGLNWSLNAGGGIYRSVSNRADEQDGAWFQDGFLTDEWYELYNLNTNTPTYWQPQMRGNNSAGTGKARLTDHNPDQFTYSFLGFSGGFIFDTERIMIKDNLDNIEFDFDGFLIETAWDQHGNEYTFGPTEVSDNKNAYAGSVQSSTGMPTFDEEDYDWPEVITGWKLSKIVTKNNSEVNFLYNTLDINYVLNPSEENISMAVPCKTHTPEERNPKRSNTITTYNYSNKLISEINSKMGETTIVKIIFDYQTDNNLSHWKTKLMKITIFDMLSGRKKGYRFVYGKFSGDPRLKLTEVYEFGNDGATEKPPYVFEYNTSYSLPAKDSRAQDFFGYYNNKTFNNSLVHWDVAVQGYGPFFKEQTFLNTSTGNRSLDPNAIKAGILEKITYPTGGRTEFTFEANETGGKYVGGLRIQELKEVDETGTYSKKAYEYFGLNGYDMESNLFLTTKNNGPSPTFYSSFVEPPGGIYMTGYYYDKVAITSIDTINLESYKEEHMYEMDSYSSISFKYSLKEKKYFKGGTAVKTEEYINALIGTPRTFKWNVLGDMVCYGNSIPQLGYGYNKILRRVGNYAYLPVQVITTDYLKLGSSLDPVTKVQFIDYDDETLLKTQEIISTRYRRKADGSLEVGDENGEETIIYHKYPWSPGINLNLPAALPIGKEVWSSNYTSGPISGQFFEYDANSNIKRTYQYNKGAVSNTNPPAYVPSNYEEISTFIFSNGKPVQTLQKEGEATSYIWGYNNQYPVAKVEGVPYAALVNQGHVDALQNATRPFNQNNFTNAANALRGAYAHAMVTTYTHRPLAGVETITDPKGDKITYHYDALGRLKKVTDKDGKILSENEYNYRPH